jgi:hypothetical protein
VEEEKAAVALWTNQAPGSINCDYHLAHDLINKLSVIVGTCDLMAQKTPESSPTLQPMLLIRNVARSRAADLGQFQVRSGPFAKHKSKRTR